MPKLPGADHLLHRLQGLAPLAIYIASAVMLLWTAFLLYTDVLGPLQNPGALDPTQLIQRQEQVKGGPYTATLERFPARPAEVTAPPNPFAR